MPAVPVEPTDDRKVVVCMADGTLWSMSIIEFVVVRVNQDLWEVLGREPTPEEVAPHTAVAAARLSMEGWFSADEYMADYARLHSEEMDDELRAIVEGES